MYPSETQVPSTTEEMSSRRSRRVLASKRAESSADCDSSDSESGSDSDENFAFVNLRHFFTDPHDGDDINCLNAFAAYGDAEFWTIDMRLTLLWCLAYEARFRRRAPALELWLAIIDGERERVSWDMWEDGDEIWLRNMTIQRRMTNRFRVTTAKLSSTDWMLARDALERRIGRPKPGNPLGTWSTQHRVLRIAWCAVTDGFPAVGGKYLDLMKPIDSWNYFTCPLRPAYDQDMKLKLHDAIDCPLSSCKISVWQWFRTAILDYDINQIQSVIRCCDSCISRALLAINCPQLSNSIEEPAIWPVILWVAFQVRTRDSVRAFESRTIDAFFLIIKSNDEDHLGLWSWDDTDEQTLRHWNLISPTGNSSWIDRYPPSWREYIILLDSNDWVNLEILTRCSSRPRLAPLEYDTTIRVGAIVLWAASASIPDPPHIDMLLALDRFLPENLASNDRGFLRCMAEGRPGRASLNIRHGSETVDWNHPRIWLEQNRAQLRLTVLRDLTTAPLVHAVENVHLLHHLSRALPLYFLSVIFAALLKKGVPDKWLDKFRASINKWKAWDTMVCLINFRSVLDAAFEFSKLIGDRDLPKSVIDVVINTDISCICAQFVDVLRDPGAYGDFLKARNEEAHELLDLLQDLLDYPLLDAQIRPVLLKALLKLSTRSGRHPRCFALSDLQLANHPVAAGSFGDVYKGLIHGERVSVKVMRVYQEADVEALFKEFSHEALIWRQLSHPNLLPFFGVYYPEATKCRLCLVSPWMENGNVARYLKASPARVNRLTLVLDVALGLEHLHGLKLVHGDLKAINVLVTRSGRAVLADFGLSSVTDSKILQLTTSLAKSGGTVRWQAPELFNGAPNSFASDVYAFSCVCYEIFTGNLPFYELVNDVAVMFHVMHGKRPKRLPSMLDAVWNLLMECWNAEPDQRPSAKSIVVRFRDSSIGALPTNAAADWDPWYTSKFRSSLEGHMLFLP